MVILDSTAKSLIAYMAGAHTTTQPTFVTAWLDTDGTTDTEGSTVGSFNDASNVTLCAAPASNHRRIIKSISIYNADTVSQTISIGMLVTATVYLLLAPTVVPTLQSLVLGMDNVFTVNQGTNTTDSPTFANLTDSALTASRLVLSDASKKLASNSALTTNYLPKAASSGASLADSLIFDDGTNIRIPASCQIQFGSGAGYLRRDTTYPRTLLWDTGANGDKAFHLPETGSGVAGGQRTGEIVTFGLGDVTAANFEALVIDARKQTDFRIATSNLGSGAARPIVFLQGSGEAFRINADSTVSFSTNVTFVQPLHSAMLQLTVYPLPQMLLPMHSNKELALDLSR